MAKKDRHVTMNLSHEEIDSRVRERLWPDERGNAEEESRYEALCAKLRDLPPRERLAVMLKGRINPLNPETRLKQKMVAKMRVACGIPPGSLWKYAGQGREKLRT